MEYTFPALIPSIPIASSNELYPVRRIYCVGRNYIEHAEEMGYSGREAPFFFMKPADAILVVPHGSIGEMPYPSMTSELHYELELVVAMGAGGKNISITEAPQHIWGYAVGLDMTRRDLQGEAKKLGHPWETGKGFDHSAPISPLHPISETGLLTKAAIRLDVNGVTRQHSDIEKLIWSVPETIAHLSQFFTLQPGDLIFTGTPKGVAAVHRGDLLEGAIEGVGELYVKII